MVDLNAAEREVRRLAQQAFDELLARIAAGEVSRDAIAEIQARFSGRYAKNLAKAFSSLLGQFVGVDQVRALPIGKVKLSGRLYQNANEVTADVRRTIVNHAKGMQDARALALQIFEGYGFKGGADPLKVKAGLPKYLAEAMQDAEFGTAYKVLARRIGATVVKTEALKAAYLGALEEVIKGPGNNRLERALKIAQFERNRYFANRIAQTELHRADTDRIASNVMADAELEVVQIVLSSTHPKDDICDLHAKVDKWELGPGCYPKALAPKPPFHPFCRCLLRKRFDLSGKGAREVPGADAAFLRDHGRGGLVMGSRANLEQVLGGRPVENVLNDGKDPLYYMRRLGDSLDLGEGARQRFAVLPNFKEATIPDEKLRDYALNSEHGRGGDKARVFAAVFGFTAVHAGDLASQILDALERAPALSRQQDVHGQRYQVDVTVTGPKGSGIVRTGWIIRRRETSPRMTSAVAIKPRGQQDEPPHV